MKFRILALISIFVAPIFSFASSLASATRAVIPADVQQVINVDYRSMEDSQSGQALKARVLPEQLKSQSVSDQVVAEYKWTLARLADHGLARACAEFKIEN